MTELPFAAWLIPVLVAVLVALWVVFGAASRLDRLHRRVLESRATLDAQLVRRATAALDLALAGVLDPVSSVLVSEAAREALDHVPLALGPVDEVAGARGPGHRPAPAEPEEIDQEMAESELTRVLRAALGDAADRAALAEAEDAAELLDRLDREWYRAQLARRFYNDAVVQVRRIRAKGYVRLLRLAGRAPLPQTFEMDDATGNG